MEGKSGASTHAMERDICKYEDDSTRVDIGHVHGVNVTRLHVQCTKGSISAFRPLRFYGVWLASAVAKT